MGEFKQKAIQGVAWSTIQSLSNKFISFILLIFMARLLQPTDYGMVAMLAIFIAIADAFVDCGFGQAIIRKQDRTITDESTVYYFNIAASTICYLIIFAIAPVVADFYNMLELKSLLRLIGLKLVISSFSSMHVLQYTIALNFKMLAIVNASSNVLSGAVGLYFAYCGYGAWALAIQQVVRASITVLVYFIFSSWKPKLTFSKKSFDEMFAFGSKLLGVRILNIFYSNITTIFIGKAYSSKDLGLYSKGQEMAAYPSDILHGIVTNVTYPLLCSVQSDRALLSKSYRQIIKFIGFVIFPVMTMVGVLAKPIIFVLFGEQWLQAAFYLAMISYPYMIIPVCVANFSLLQVVGRSGLVLKLEIVTKIMGVIMLLITLPISIEAMCWGTIVNVTLCLFIDTFYTSKFIDVSLRQQLSDLLKPFIVCALMAVVVYITAGTIDNNILKLVVGSLSGIFFYVIVALITGSSELKFCLDIIKRKRV